MDYLAQENSRQELRNTVHSFSGPARPSLSRSPPEPALPRLPDNSHPAAFSFPRLSPDGSVQDIAASTVEPRRAAPFHRTTPAAALSTLGARLRMEERGPLNDSVSSLADSQYDMLDDASESSNDDHETASIASTPRHSESEDGQRPFEFVENDLTSRREQENNVHAPSTSQPPRGGFINDSDQSDDDLETPRQSILPDPPSSPDSRPIGLQHAPNTAPRPRYPNAPFRVLFVSEPCVDLANVSLVCSRIGDCLASSKPGRRASSSAQVIQLPPTPGEGSDVSSMMICTGGLEMMVQRCVGAAITAERPKKYSLQMLGQDPQQTSFMSIDWLGNADLEVPDLAILYVREPYMAWFDEAKEALSMIDVPVAAVCDRGIDIENMDLEKKQEIHRRAFVIPLKALMDDFQMPREVFQNMFGPPEYTPRSSTTLQHPTVSSSSKQKKKTVFGQPSSHITSSLLVLVLAAVPYFLFLFSPSSVSGMFQTRFSPAVELAVRRDALTTALLNLSNSIDVTNDYNIEHLVPSNSCTSTRESSSNAHFQGVAPNHIVVSLLKQAGSRSFPHARQIMTHKPDGTAVVFNSTKLIDGVYSVMVSPDEANGIIFVNMLVGNPPMNVTVSHNFGHRLLQRSTYQRASISKATTKELSVIRNAAKSWTDRLALPIAAGVMATKNLTTDLTLYVARDLQVFGDRALSIFSNVVSHGNQTFASIQKDLVQVQKDLMERCNLAPPSISAATTSLKSVIPSTKRIVAGPLSRSRERAMRLKERFSSGPRRDNNTSSATKDLSIRLQNFFNPTDKTKRTGEIGDIARCARAQDYRACRKEQKKASKTRKSNLSSSSSSASTETPTSEATPRSALVTPGKEEVGPNFKGVGVRQRRFKHRIPSKDNADALRDPDGRSKKLQAKREKLKERKEKRAMGGQV